MRSALAGSVLGREVGERAQRVRSARLARLLRISAAVTSRRCTAAAISRAERVSATSQPTTCRQARQCGQEQNCEMAELRTSVLFAQCAGHYVSSDALVLIQKGTMSTVQMMEGPLEALINKMRTALVFLVFWQW